MCHIGSPGCVAIILPVPLGLMDDVPGRSAATALPRFPVGRDCSGCTASQGFKDFASDEQQRDRNDCSGPMN